MSKKVFHIGLLLCYFIAANNSLLAQEMPDKSDTFFLAKKKGLLGRFGRSISRTAPEELPVKVENQFMQYKGKIIRSVETVRLGFEYDIDDTTKIQQGFGAAIGKKFHRITSGRITKNSLFFKIGDPVYPYLLADNERYLRDLAYLKDARILVRYAEGNTDSVDLLVLTKDVFSIGANLNISSVNNVRTELREENFAGTGTRLVFNHYYEKGRDPQMGFGAEMINRNIGGSFIDLVTGYQDYRNAFSSNRNQETVAYARIEKPLVTPFIPATGALEWSYRRTRNVYDADSLYQANIKYAYYNLDAWFGYSLDSKRSLYANKEIKIHRFVAVRGFKQHFLETPLKYKHIFDYRFTDFTGALASLNIFKQKFYRSSFIYGFGRSEDIPEGFSIAVTGGYVNKQTRKRPYSGLDVSLARFGKKGFYSSYTFRVGGYFYKKGFEDVDLLFNVDHFTRLRKLSNAWYHRFFISTGITAQANPVLNTPLFLNSEFGLPYFRNGTFSSDLRATIKAETVFYNTTKVLGFRFAPFAFSDFIFIKPSTQGLNKADLFMAVGGGVRTRNENLVFGTVELRVHYFPRLIEDINPWRVELKSNIRFRYRSSFISRPDVIVAN